MVGNISTHRAMALLLALIFSALQGISIAHAMEHGNEEHDHDGVPCVISVFADRNDDTLCSEQTPPQLLEYSDTHRAVPAMQHTDAGVTQTQLARAPPRS